VTDTDTCQTEGLPPRRTRNTNETDLRSRLDYIRAAARQSITLPLPSSIPVNQYTMATDESDAAPPTGVWVHLFYDDPAVAIGEVYKIKSIPDDVSHLKSLVIDLFKDDLKGIPQLDS
jgi:hypothetical protein